MSFELYQEARSAAEDRIKEILFTWAMSDAPDELTLLAIRELKKQLTFVLNGTTRRCYDIGVNEARDLQKSA